MTCILETERLRLRQLSPKDADFMLTLLNSPGWLQYIGDRNVNTEGEALAFLENGPFRSYQENGYGLSLVERKEDNNAIGVCGIINRDGLDNPDIGFALLPEYQRNGYAFEIAYATLNYARKDLNIPEISAICLENNRSSVQLLEKIGLKFVRTFSFPDTSEELLLYTT